MASKNNQSEKIMSPSVIITMIVCGILLIAVIAVALVMRSGAYLKSQDAVTVGDETVNAVEYAYFYNTTVNNYLNSSDYYYYLYLMGYDFSVPPSRQETTAGEQTWLEYFVELASDGVVQNTVLYLEGQKAGFTLEQSEVDEYVDEYIESVKAAATSYNYSFKDYLEAAYCNGMDEATLRDCVTRAYYVSEYYEHFIETIEVTDEETVAHRDENLAQYTTVTLRSNNYAYTASDDASTAEALAKAQQHVAEGVTAEAFEEVAHKMLEAEKQEENADKDLTLKEDVAVSSYTTEIQEWLLSEERVEGDVAYFNQGNSYVALYFISTELLDYNVRDFSYIYVPAETVADNEETEEDESEVTDEQLAAALASAEAIVNEFLAGEKTKEAFTALAEAKIA